VGNYIESLCDIDFVHQAREIEIKTIIMQKSEYEGNDKSERGL
jgi:hypothetical protein